MGSNVCYLLAVSLPPLLFEYFNLQTFEKLFAAEKLKGQTESVALSAFGSAASAPFAASAAASSSKSCIPKV